MPSTKEVLYGSCFGCSHYDVCAYVKNSTNIKKEFEMAKKDININVPYPFRIVLICDKWQEDTENVRFC